MTVFLIIAAAGLLFIVASFFLGEIFGDLDFDGDGSGDGVINTRVLAVFVLSFGSFGAIATHLGYGAAVSSLAGLAGGLALGGLVALFGWFLHKQQASSSVGQSQLVGRTAQVTVSIPAGGVGQVLCRVGEERVEKLARARDGAELKAGSVVLIEDFAGDSAIVSAAGDHYGYLPRA
ncbi:MAG TPA: hypothetical protein VEY09_06385 [Pyrinomonadaceae bacterium]|nr:hypothetical protein [Pyrinomonadaceae bacterium]